MRQYTLIDLHMPGSLGYITFNDYVYIYIYIQTFLMLFQYYNKGICKVINQSGYLESIYLIAFNKIYSDRIKVLIY